MKKKIVWVITAVMFFSLLSFSDYRVLASSIDYEPLKTYNIKTYTGGIVKLSGTVIKSAFEDVQFGNIKMNECTLLQLDEPINISLRTYNGVVTRNNYEKIQICYVGDTPHDAMTWVGKHVVVQGRLAESPSGHYYDSVLLDIDNIQLSEQSTDTSLREENFKVFKPEKTKLKKIIRKNKRKALVKWRKIKGVSGYIIQYSADSNFKKVNIKKIKNGTSSSAVIKKLKNNKKYYVRICTFIKENNKKYKSNWSDLKIIKN